MHVFRGLPDPLLRRPSAVAIGSFDGVHLGHQSLLHSVCEAATLRGLVPSVVTFEPHPKDLFGRSAEVTRLSTLYDKVMRILDTGIQRVYILPFHKRFAARSGESFIREILSEGLDTRWITVGNDFHFGSDRQGNIDLLERLAPECRYELAVAPSFFHKDDRVSSTRIRQRLADSDFYEAAVMLGHRYTMTGRVIHGAALGRTLGFPTLNMMPMPPGSLARPAVSGVFAVRVWGLGTTHFTEDVPLNGVASLGVKPTVSSDGRWLLETHVFDWMGDAYGKVVRIEFIERLRGEQKFAGLEELKAAIENDACRARRILGMLPPEGSIFPSL